jgi:hypothetical protein
MSDVKSHGTEILVDKIFHLNQQLESMNKKYEDLQLLYTKAVTTNRDLKTRVFVLKNDNEDLKEKNDHGDYGFDLTGDVTAEDRKLNGQASHRDVSIYKVKRDT